MSEKQNMWQLAAAWWFLMITFGATLTIPVLGWDEVWAPYRLLIGQAPCIFVVGYILEAPARYVTRMVLIGVLFMLPAALSCLAPAIVIAFILDPQRAPAHAFVIIVPLSCLLIWRIMNISGREDKWSRKPISSYVSTCKEVVRFVGPSSKEGQEHNLLRYVIWLSLLYPPLIFLVWFHYDEPETVYFLTAMPLAWIGIEITAWSASNFVHWILRIRRYELANGIHVYIEPPSESLNNRRRRSTPRAKK